MELEPWSLCNLLDLLDWGSIPGLGRSPGEGNGYSLQYSCLENSIARGAWRATVHGVADSQTLLSDFHFFIIKITITSVPSSTCMISFHPTKTLQVRYYRLHCWDRGTEAQKEEWVQNQTAGIWRSQIQTQPLSHSRAHTSDNEMISLSSKAPSTVPCPKHSRGLWLPFHRSWRSSSRRCCDAQRKHFFHLEGVWEGLKGHWPGGQV